MSEDVHTHTQTHIRRLISHIQTQAHIHIHKITQQEMMKKKEVIKNLIVKTKQ